MTEHSPSAYESFRDFILNKMSRSHFEQKIIEYEKKREGAHWEHKRHVKDYFGLNQPEINAINQ